MVWKRLSAAITVAAFFCPAAHAEAISPPAITLSGGVTTTTDYMFRGVSQTGGRPAIQAVLTATHRSGIYASAWTSNVGAATSPDRAEFDLSGGFSRSFGSLTPDIGVIAYLYPGTNIRVWEGYASLRKDFGPAAVKVGLFFAPDQKDTDRNIYVFTDVTAPVPGSPITLIGHAGYSDGGLALGQDHYTDYSIGADMAFGKFTANLSYIATDFRTRFNDADARLVATLSFAL
jgi:uncharacterized protein (TIGR02001 family)